MGFRSFSAIREFLSVILRRARGRSSKRERLVDLRLLIPCERANRLLDIGLIKRTIEEIDARIELGQRQVRLRMYETRTHQP